MHLIYDSENYCVVEYFGDTGYEVVDKTTSRGVFLHGESAERFRECMFEAIAGDASVEQLDEFLDGLDSFYTEPIVYH